MQSQQVPKDIVVILDEAYWEYNDAEDTPNSAEEIFNYPMQGLHNWAQFGYQLEQSKPQVLNVMNAW